MSNYIPSYQKRNRIFSKRVRELEHAANHGAKPEVLVELAENVRDAKLKALQAQSQAPSIKRINDLESQLERWRIMSTQDIISKLVRAKSKKDISERALDE